MSRLRIRHETTYEYTGPVTFGPWRLMMRPIDTHGQRLLEAGFELSPGGATRWTYDAYGNSICHFQPEAAASRLQVVSNLLIERFPAPLAPLTVDDPRNLAPIVYSAAERLVLHPYTMPVIEETPAEYHEWLRAHASLPDEPALEHLRRLNEAIHKEIPYAARHEYGTQTPAETLERGSGTCRDLAWLMIESARVFGYAARFVTGYVYANVGADIIGACATHAWCEAFLPDLGWMEFDPTNGLVESEDLIRVAATRTPQEASPMSGIVVDDPGGTVMNVSVRVEPEPEPEHHEGVPEPAAALAPTMAASA